MVLPLRVVAPRAHAHARRRPPFSSDPRQALPGEGRVRREAAGRHGDARRAVPGLRPAPDEERRGRRGVRDLSPGGGGRGRDRGRDGARRRRGRRRGDAGPRRGARCRQRGQRPAIARCHAKTGETSTSLRTATCACIPSSTQPSSCDRTPDPAVAGRTPRRATGRGGLRFLRCRSRAREGGGRAGAAGAVLRRGTAGTWKM